MKLSVASVLSAVSAVLGRGHLSVEVDSGDSLDVRRFSVAERISSLFTVTLEAVSENAGIDLDAVLGRPASFTIVGAHTRTWSGICTSFEQIKAEEMGVSTYRIVIAPHLWLATQRRNYRMFQHLSERDIVLALLREWGIEPEVRLGSTYKKRNYRVQYGESDYAFICRMLEDAGISFWFEHAAGESTLVLSDAPERGAPRLGSLPFKDDVSMDTGEHATKVRVGGHVRPGKYTLRDRDHRLPAERALAASAKAARGDDVAEQLERYDYTPGAFLVESTRDEATPVADDRGKYRSDEAEAAALTKRRLDAERADALACSFETNAYDVAPGSIVRISGHPQPMLSRSLLVVAADLSGSHDGEWTHLCEGRSVAHPYRPAVVTPMPKVSGIESATVVGPPGEEIHCDEFGRVRVHFHWDRQSKMDEKSSCWIPVSQAWSGSGFGAINLPRVGQEVLVDFLGGDPDRPVIVGRIHTATQPVPYKLPANKTQSGWRSESTPGGGGYNEILFEDKKGGEIVRIHAERDLQKTVKRDEEQNVGRDRIDFVERDSESTIGRNGARFVGDHSREVIGLSSVRTVGTNESVDVGANQRVSVAAASSLSVGTTYDVNVGAAMSMSAGTTKTISAGEKIVITCGAASVTLDSSGQITLAGTEIALASSGPVSITGTKVTIAGTEVSVSASGAAEVGGASLLLVGETIEQN